MEMMSGSANALDVYAQREDLKYMLATNVNVSNFVSVKLSGGSNYNIWKTQMLCLVKSQLLLHIIDASHPFPGDKGVHMIEQYDELVKGWIFGSINEKLLKEYVSLQTARDVWMKLESIFNPEISCIEGDARTQHLIFMKSFNVEVSKFVTVKLSGYRNYNIWKADMLSLIENHVLLHIINAEHPFPEEKGVHMISQYDSLVKSWIFRSTNKKVLNDLVSSRSALEIWLELESSFSSEIRETEKWLKYDELSRVYVSEFVTVELSDYRNHKIWKAQMLYLIESQGLLYIIDDEYPVPCDCIHMTEHYDKLVKGWILGSVKELKDLGYKKHTLNMFRARKIWRILDSHFNTSESDGDSDSDSDNGDSVGFMFGAELFKDVPEIENTDNIERRYTLYKAAVEGCWWKAKSVLRINQNAATEPITGEANTILHIAVEMGQNYFVEKLLEFFKELRDIEMRNKKGQTALHIAALVGNKYAAQLLVKKRKELLEIEDGDGRLPWCGSFKNIKNISIYGYLLKATPSSSLSAFTNQVEAIYVAILTKQFDLARTLLEEYRGILVPFTRKTPSESTNVLQQLTVTIPDQTKDVLQALTLTFPADLGFMESFIYPSFNNIYEKTVETGSLLFRNNFLDKCVDETLRVVKINTNTRYSWMGNISMLLVVPIATLYLIYQLICLLVLMFHLTFSMLYLHLWKVLATTVRPIKNIEKKRKEYQEAKKLLRFICEQMGNSNDGYSDSIIRAVRQGTYEVVDEILFTSPATIKCKDEEGHNIIQLAIINRSEKVYNLLHHVIERTDAYRKMKDSSKNNLVHLVGKLAPSSVLDRTTGAALQLQRELTWCAEVEKLFSPIECDDMNVDKESPATVFTREHADLLKQGEIWMKTTAESCSITAALIVTIVFAAAITVPGGSNQDTGIPVFKNKTAFTIFALFNAFSLFTAATSLLLFLSILTARFAEKDFLLSLPRRLIFGLLTLFLSTTSMIVAFGAILFLVFCDQRQWILAPICVFACLPISVIVTLKVPLLVDFYQSTYSPIFGEQHYLESCKIKRENTIFTN